MNEKKLRVFLSSLPEYNCHMEWYLHSTRVEAFGLLLMQAYTFVDADVVKWFAYLHDFTKMKMSVGHGESAADYIKTIRHTILSDLSDSQIVTLQMACALHMTTRETEDMTINVCFDADRLDIQRHGIATDPQKMATDLGKRLAKYGYASLLDFLYTDIGVRDSFTYSDKYITETYYARHYALRFLAADGQTSPFVGGMRWESGHKSVSCDCFYRKSGIYAIPLDCEIKNEFYISLILSNTKVCLLEYGDEDVNYKDELTAEQLQRLREDFKGKISEDSFINKSEVALKRCNIVYEGKYEDCLKEHEGAMKRFEEAKERQYWIRQFKTINPAFQEEWINKGK